jgi:hypothetical protein
VGTGFAIPEILDLPFEGNCWNYSKPHSEANRACNQPHEEAIMAPPQVMQIVKGVVFFVFGVEILIKR